MDFEDNKYDMFDKAKPKLYIVVGDSSTLKGTLFLVFSGIIEVCVV